MVEVYVFSPLSAPLRTWFHTWWTWIRKSCWGTHHIRLLEPCLSMSKTSLLFFAQIPGQAFLQNMRLPLQRWLHGTITCEDQISHKILLQHPAQAKFALQRDFQLGQSAARPQLPPHLAWGKGRTFVPGVGSGVTWREEGKDLGQVWSREGSQKGFSRAWERQGEAGQESLACPEMNAGWSWCVSLSQQLFQSWTAQGRSSEAIKLDFFICTLWQNTSKLTAGSNHPLNIFI